MLCCFFENEALEGLTKISLYKFSVRKQLR